MRLLLEETMPISGHSRKERRMIHLIVRLLILCLVLIGCASGSENHRQDTDQLVDIAALRFIGEQRLPSNQTIDGTKVGGISGIDYAPDGTWFLLSDDRSESSAARMYKAHLNYNAQEFEAVDILSHHVLLQPDGAPFPEGGVDPEAIRFSSNTNTLWWTSEGDRNELQDPFLHEMELDGTYRSRIPLPAHFAMSDQERGPRNNGMFEGLSLSTGDKGLWIITELPLYQDGPEPTPSSADTPVRLTRFNAETREPTVQYAYMLDPLAEAPEPETAFAVNGVTEILAFGDDRLLVMERSFSMGRGFVVKVYKVDIKGATNVLEEEALVGAAYQPVRKTLLLDFADIDGLSMVSNIEGVAFGPDLPNGNSTLVFVSDNNFNAFLMTQFMAFEVVSE